MEKRIIKSLAVIAFFILTILTVSSTHTIIPISQKNAPYPIIFKTISPDNPSRDETELKYYKKENLDQVIGVCGEAIWKSAIRLTQEEMGPYKNWIMTKVNVAAVVNQKCSSVDVRIFIYDKGTEIHPGNLIANDTASCLTTTGVHTIPLVTPVDLSGFEELWVAVQWTENTTESYAWIDTVSGPHVENKSDFVYLGNDWSQLHDALPGCDGRWGIGAIVEGVNVTELSVGNIEGPKGIEADVFNVGAYDANNVQWTIQATGGILKKINKTAIGTTAKLVACSSIPINLQIFFGFGKINIVVTAKAENAVEVIVTKSAFLLGPYTIRIN